MFFVTYLQQGCFFPLKDTKEGFLHSFLLASVLLAERQCLAIFVVQLLLSYGLKHMMPMLGVITLDSWHKICICGLGPHSQRGHDCLNDAFGQQGGQNLLHRSIKQTVMPCLR